MTIKNVDELIAVLTEIKSTFGNLPITGGYLSEDGGVRGVSVIDDNSEEVWPTQHAAEPVEPLSIWIE